MTSCGTAERAGLPRRYRTPRLTPEQIDPDAAQVVRRLTDHGYEAYLVGGCVRDLLLGRKPKDFDVGTSARPRQVRRLFRNCRVIGRRFKLAHVIFGQKVIEVATFRQDPIGDEEPGPEDAPDAGEGGADSDRLIRSDNTFGTAEDDARRRDFPINALFYDMATAHVMDFVGGVADLRERRVQTIGDPRVRVAEDPVRILRAVRFASRLSFRIEPATWAAMVDLAADLDRCARPRVLDEIHKLLVGGAAGPSFRLLARGGLHRVVLPELADALEGEEGERVFAMMDRMDLVRLAGIEVSGSLGLAIAFEPLVRRALGERGDGAGASVQDVEDAVVEVLAPFAARMHLPRRSGFLIRQFLAAAERLRDGARARARLLAAAGRDSFPQLAAFLWVRAGVDKELWPPYRSLARSLAERGLRTRLMEPPEGPEAVDAPGAGRPWRGRRRGKAM
ncbi:MAG: polynucleotide adenylyltransferase PcnB [Planctomycetes bacterium]|nr:polynucleotide adenylyltransferase PcnB [Planctomycetota bacterium]